MPDRPFCRFAESETLPGRCAECQLLEAHPIHTCRHDGETVEHADLFGGVSRLCVRCGARVTEGANG